MEKRYNNRQLASDVRERISKAVKNPRRIYGYAHWGWYKDSPENPQKGDVWVGFDGMTHGLHEKKMIYLGGRPKCGKSMLIASLLPNIAEQCPEGQMIRLISLEMSAEAYLERMASIMARVADPTSIYTGFMTTEEHKRLDEALEYLGELPIEIVEKATLSQLSSIIGNKDVPTFMWVLDNFGLLSGADYKDIVSAANIIQQLCQHTATGIIIGHLNRASVGKRPTIESIGGSDQIGRNSDEIWLLYKVLDGLEVDPAIVEEGEPAELVFFSRSGPGGIITLWWDKKNASYAEMTVEQKEDMPVIPKKAKGK